MIRSEKRKSLFLPKIYSIREDKSCGSLWNKLSEEIMDGSTAEFMFVMIFFYEVFHHSSRAFANAKV